MEALCCLTITRSIGVRLVCLIILCIPLTLRATTCRAYINQGLLWTLPNNLHTAATNPITGMRKQIRASFKSCVVFLVEYEQAICNRHGSFQHPHMMNLAYFRLTSRAIIPVRRAPSRDKRARQYDQDYSGCDQLMQPNLLICELTLTRIRFHGVSMNRLPSRRKSGSAPSVPVLVKRLTSAR